MKTFRRDKLRRLIESGKVVCVSSYDFEDGVGESRTTTEMPVRIRKPNETYRDCPQGVLCLLEHDFKSSSGSCYEENGIITLHVHSNLNYKFRVVEQNKGK